MRTDAPMRAGCVIVCAILADTSSAAVGSTARVGEAAAWAVLRLEPLVAKSVAAEVIICGAAITYDMSVHLLGHGARRRPMDDTATVDSPVALGVVDQLDAVVCARGHLGNAALADR
jgi:hypothetical protein